MRSVLAIALCVFCHVPRAQAAEKPGGAEGRVLDTASGEPIRKAMVILRRNQESGAAAYTDAKGEFHFAELEPGAYALSVMRDGYVAGRKDPPILVTSVYRGTGNGINMKTNILTDASSSSQASTLLAPSCYGVFLQMSACFMI